MVIAIACTSPAQKANVVDCIDIYMHLLPVLVLMRKKERKCGDFWLFLFFSVVRKKETVGYR